MAAIVYLATNRADGKRYLGVTKYGLAKRRDQHINSAWSKRPTCRVFHAALRKYGQASFDWSMLRARSTYAQALAEEVRLIAEMAPEYNLQPGGQGSESHRKRSAEGRVRWRAAMVGRKQSPEHIERCRLARIGQKRTPEQRERMGASRRGSAFSEEHRHNLSVSHKGKKQSPEQIERRIRGQRGKPLSAEHRARVSAAITAVWARRRATAGASP